MACGSDASAQPITQKTPFPESSAPSVGAHARFSKSRINVGDPDLRLTAAFIAAGGGAGGFDAGKWVAALTAGAPTAGAETASLTKRFGTDNVASFTKTFDYFVTDALAQTTAGGISLPPASPIGDPGDTKALAAALYAAGETSRGSFDTEYMLDGLFSHVVHVAVMNDIDANPDLGPKADANFHSVLSQVMADVKSQNKL